MIKLETAAFSNRNNNCLSFHEGEQHLRNDK